MPTVQELLQSPLIAEILMEPGSSLSQMKLQHYVQSAVSERTFMIISASFGFLFATAMFLIFGLVWFNWWGSRLDDMERSIEESLVTLKRVLEKERISSYSCSYMLRSPASSTSSFKLSTPSNRRRPPPLTVQKIRESEPMVI
eukprot:764250-Hanusia_phi.AAC.1